MLGVIDASSLALPSSSPPLNRRQPPSNPPSTPNFCRTSTSPSSVGPSDNFFYHPLDRSATPSSPLVPPVPCIPLFPLSTSPAASCSSPFHAGSPGSSSFLSVVRGAPSSLYPIPSPHPTTNIRLHLPTPKSNSSLLLAAAALAAAAAAAVEAEATPSKPPAPSLGPSPSPPPSSTVGDVKGPRRRRRRGIATLTAGATPTRMSMRRHTVHSDSTTATGGSTGQGPSSAGPSSSPSGSDINTAAALRLTEQVLDEHDALLCSHPLGLHPSSSASAAAANSAAGDPRWQGVAVTPTNRSYCGANLLHPPRSRNASREALFRVPLSARSAEPVGHRPPSRCPPLFGYSSAALPSSSDDDGCDEEGEVDHGMDDRPRQSASSRAASAVVVGEAEGLGPRRRSLSFRGSSRGQSMGSARAGEALKVVAKGQYIREEASEEEEEEEAAVDGWWGHSRCRKAGGKRNSRERRNAVVVDEGVVPQPLAAAAKPPPEGSTDLTHHSCSSASRLLLPGDLTLHCQFLSLYSAFHLLLLVFTSGFYPKLNNSLDFRASTAVVAPVPRYGPDEWSFYRHLNVSITAFMRASIAWAVVYALVLRAGRAALQARPRLGRLLHRLYGLWCITCLVVQLSVFFFGGMTSKCVFFPDVWLGSLYEHWVFDSELFAAFGAMDAVLFGLSLAIDLLGLGLVLRGASRHLHSMWDTLIPVCGLAVLMGLGSYFTAQNPSCNSSDHHWVNFTDHHPHNIDVRMGGSPTYAPLKFPVYIPMSDGVRLALDVYLPRQYLEGFRRTNNTTAKDHTTPLPPLPTYVDVTRYDRRMTALWPFTMLRIWKEPRDSSVNVWSWQFVQALIPNGYAVVVVDSRGTGASEGHREVDFSAEELNDFEEIVGWAKRQWWCNGELGMGGISYDGMTGLQAAARGGVKAAVALFTPMDVIGDLLAPGGMVCSSFVRDYVGLTAKFEEEGTPLKHHLNYPWHYPLHVILGFLTSFGGALPVHRHEAVAARALEEHEKNWDMGKVVQQVEYLDDNITLTDGRILPVASFGITEGVMENLAAHNVSVYIAGGYCDSAIVRGASRLYEYMKKHAPDSGTKLVVGPWTHSGRRSCTPYSGTYPCFEISMYLDLVRYLDCHLKGHCWGGLLEEPPVRYWQVGDEEWRSSDSYPPLELQYTELHFSNQPLGADLRPLEVDAPEGIVMVNNTVVEELHGGRKEAEEDEEEEETGTEDSDVLDGEGDDCRHSSSSCASRPASFYARRHQRRVSSSSSSAVSAVVLGSSHNALLEHIIHDITQLTYIRLKRPGSHYLHNYHRTQSSHTHHAHRNRVVPPRLNQHQEFLSKDAYVLRPKAALLSHSSFSPSSSNHRIYRHYSSSSSSGRRSGSAAVGQQGRRSRAASTVHDVVSFKVDYQATTGIFTRWLIAQHPFRMGINYGNLLFPSRASRPMRQRQNAPPPDSALASRGPHRKAGRAHSPVSSSGSGGASAFSSRLSFTTEGLTEPLRMVGSPWVNFSTYVSGCTEVSLFVYLEDVDLAHGYSHYVTEGKVVASHRVTNTGKEVPVGSPDAVHRTYSRKDYLPVQGSELVEMSLTLEPVSWTFQKGHAIRVSMGGADVDNFELRDHAGILPVLPDKWQIIVNDPSNFPAWVRLPTLLPSITSSSSFSLSPSASTVPAGAVAAAADPGRLFGAAARNSTATGGRGAAGAGVHCSSELTQLEI